MLAARIAPSPPALIEVVHQRVPTRRPPSIPPVNLSNADKSRRAHFNLNTEAIHLV